MESAVQMLVTLVLGALMGFLGQGARAVVGLKTMSDDAKSQGVSSSDLFQAARLVVSMIVGLLVGLAAALIYLASGSTGAPDWHVLLGFAAAGYAGADFLEAFIGKYLAPSGQQQKTIAFQTAPGATPTLMSALAPMSTPTPSTATPSTPKQLVYSVILQLEPNEQLTDATTLQSLGYDDFESKDILRWAIDKRQWRGVVLPVGALTNCTKVSDVTQVVTNALPKVTPPNAQPKAASPNASQQKADPSPATS